MLQGALIYITGFSGSGKSTLAKQVVASLQVNKGIKAIFLDGDTLRECVHNFDYTSNGRMSMAMYYVKIAKILVDQGFVVVLATISMFDKVRDFNRENFKVYLEIFLDVSLEIRQKRDSKNFFKNNTINMVGLNQEAELPKNSHLVFKDEVDTAFASEKILRLFSDLTQL
ncbi:adenylyl-sulfate kinase [Campylobacter hyointestinalis subsp. hyointestinalis]|uniref:Adenylyl-sulfate kinase n=2 Tax=Campylobacter hyointestinalis TaxID=198 RepID=A0A2S5JBH4_CAMHY|nr:adenylylsulfate kinase [Campylobacter hyointestinalis subsp. hyointestinalis]RAZ46460.1 adenylyl-sulfate kinase [Campylobacter hyointestinalis subsp. lawsonii]TWO18188.1 adenylyl-sulfate kinase [Campylobacter hyointestinalis]PPB53305.1 adenylyl-sulfate kinase [Campylobacter hyointestinalis subsp. hyointestinalis]PPB56681.1 adenylyl-sulfate kinase [Campylobacter hyointestinalis subsp. hyointestinalis]